MIFDERNIYRLLLMFLSLSVWQDGRMYQRISARSGDHVFPAYFKAECASLSLSLVQLFPEFGYGIIVPDPARMTKQIFISKF